MNQGEVIVSVRVDDGKLTSGLKGAENKVKGFTRTVDDATESSVRKADAAFSRFAKSAGIALAAIGVSAAAGIASAFKSAGTFQSSLSQLGQASGATGKQLDSMSKLARDLGRDNALAGVTASDAALSMVELSKAGLSVSDTMAATRGVLSLAKAGNIEFADAATIAASALNAFGLSGKDASKVADTLAAGANASQADLSDLAEGMQQSATVAKQFGLSLNESVTALSLFANNGIRGSDAGTSLKTMLIALAKPSKEAAGAMADIGFSAYDASGKFVGLDEMSSRLHKSLKGLSKQQQQNTLATIFGNDAFRAAAVLSDNAGKSFDSMSKAVGKNGAAQEAARAKMGAYQRATEGLSNQFSDLGLTLGDYVLPTITDATNSFAGFIGKINSGIPGTVQTIRSLLPVISGVSAGIVGFTVVQNASTIATKAMTIAQGALNMAMKANPFALVAGAAIGITTAYIGVITQSSNSKNAQDRLNLAMQAGKTATDNLKLSQQALKDAMLGQQGAALAVEGAQKRYNEAVRQYGPKSYEARVAAYDLKIAQQQLRDATQQVKDKTDSARAAQQRVVDAKKNIVIANNQIRDSAYGVAGGYASWAANVKEAVKQDQKAPNRGFVNSTNSFFKLQPTQPGHRASGGPVSAGMPYLVGENPDGSINKTTEMFVPNTGGYIVNASNLQKALFNMSSPNTRSPVEGGKTVQIIQHNQVNTPLDMNVVNRSLAREINR